MQQLTFHNESGSTVRYAAQLTEVRDVREDVEDGDDADSKGAGDADSALGVLHLRKRVVDVTEADV